MCQDLNKNAEKAYYATTASPDNQLRAARVSVRERFSKQLHDSDSQKQKAIRVLDIFNRHPEFEEFIELLELLNMKY